MLQVSASYPNMFLIKEHHARHLAAAEQARLVRQARSERGGPGGAVRRFVLHAVAMIVPALRQIEQTR